MFAALKLQLQLLQSKKLFYLNLTLTDVFLDIRCSGGETLRNYNDQIDKYQFYEVFTVTGRVIFVTACISSQVYQFFTGSHVLLGEEERQTIGRS